MVTSFHRETAQDNSGDRLENADDSVFLSVSQFGRL
jgi:hypothetical protein